MLRTPGGRTSHLSHNPPGPSHGSKLPSTPHVYTSEMMDGTPSCSAGRVGLWVGVFDRMTTACTFTQAAAGLRWALFFDGCCAVLCDRIDDDSRVRFRYVRCMCVPVTKGAGKKSFELED